MKPALLCGEQWTRGCPVGIPSNGTLLAYGPWIRQPVGRIHWAGTETSPYWNGYMDGAVRSEVWPQDGILVLESPSSTAAARNRLRISRPGSYYFCASGGLGFGISAAVGVQLAEPSRPVVCVLGEGSAQYGITALWTAAAYKLPVTFLVLRNDEYMILKWFSTLEQVSGAPGLDLPGLDTGAIARGYGVSTRDAEGPEELAEAMREAIGADDGPRLIQARVASGMWLE